MLKGEDVLSLKPPRCCRRGLNYLLEEELKRIRGVKKETSNTKTKFEGKGRKRQSSVPHRPAAERLPRAPRVRGCPGLDAEPGSRPPRQLCGRPRHRGGRRDFPERPGGEALTRGRGSAGGGSRRQRRCEPEGPESAARMAAGGGRNAPVYGGEHGYRAPQHDGMRRDGGGEPCWSR